MSNKQASGRTPNLLKLAVPRFGSYRYLHMRDPFTALQYSSVERRAVPPSVLFLQKRLCFTRECCKKLQNSVIGNDPGALQHAALKPGTSSMRTNRERCFGFQFRDYWGKQVETLVFQALSKQQVSTEVLQLQAADRLTDAWIQEHRQTSHRGTAW